MKTLCIIGALALFYSPVQSADEKSSWQGIKEAKLITPTTEVIPGQTFHVGFLLSPEKGFHTYWRGPGVVGVATQLTWNLPEGFQAGEILWPPPVKTDMAGIVANGYKGEVILLTKIKVPDEIKEDTITLQVKAAWMACEKTCHPSVDNFSLTLPVAAEGSESSDPKLRDRFQSILESLPQLPPKEWKFTVAAPAENHIFLEGLIPNLTENAPDALTFFSDDMQVDSDSPTRFEWVEKSSGRFRLHFVRPDFAPSNPERFSGILCHTDGWDALSSNCVEISIPWPAAGPPDE